MVSTVLLVGLVPAMVAGRVLHELVHAGVALALGGELRRLTPSEVRYALPADAPLAYDRCIGAAPLVSGLVIGVGALVVGPPTGAVGVVPAAGWAVYTFWGDPVTDLRLGGVDDPA